MKAEVRRRLAIKEAERQRITLAALVSVETQLAGVGKYGDGKDGPDKVGREEYLIRGALRQQNARIIHHSVMSATAEELIEAGWADFERCLIPPNWRRGL